MPIKDLPSIFGIRPHDINRVFHEFDAFSPLQTHRNNNLYSTSNKYHGDGCKTNFERCDGNIVMKFKVAKDLSKVSGRKDIVKDIQYKPFKSDQPFGGPGAHNGGRMAFGPDGFLYVGTGDRHRGICGQDNSLLCSVVLRIDGNGKGASGNKVIEPHQVFRLQLFFALCHTL